jgi:hypothetical protein
MILVQKDFKTRSAEIENYFKFVQSLSSGTSVFCNAGTTTPGMTQEESESLVKTLKANGFILLYNLIESTMKNAIEAIFEELGSQGVSFDDCREEVRQIVISNLKSHNPERIFNDLKPIAQRVLTETFRKEKAFAGNVDALKIREVAKDYGFLRPSAKGDNLLTVKSNRNDLAHGDKAFAEVGRDFDIDRLVTIKDEVIVYLEEVLKNINDYLTSRGYLAAPGIRSASGAVAPVSVPVSVPVPAAATMASPPST